MTPEEEVKRLTRLIRQYETVYRTTQDSDQKSRVERQLTELRGYREKILAVNVLREQDLVDAPRVVDPLADLPLLKAMAERNMVAAPSEAVPSYAPLDVAPTAIQLEMYHLALYLAFFEREYLPFLTEKQLKLDFKYSMERDAFYNSFQAIRRRMSAYGEENQRLLQGLVNREMELEVRKRTVKLTRSIQAEAARFFRSLEHFCRDLEDDAHGDMVKCLSCNGVIRFDAIEGTRALQGRTVGGALGELRQFADEAITYLNVPDIDTQENERADRH